MADGGLFSSSAKRGSRFTESDCNVRYANIAIIEGNEASQFGIGIVSARIAEAVLRDERAVFPIGAYNAGYGVTLSLPSVVGRQGVSRILEPSMSDEERQALHKSAEVLRKAVQRTSRNSPTVIRPRA
jgi:L-lactate dehydrogenase